MSIKEIAIVVIVLSLGYYAGTKDVLSTIVAKFGG